MTPRPKTLAELYEPPNTFRWHRHRHLIRRLELEPADVELVLELDRQGFAVWQIAARLETTIGAVANCLRLHRPRVGQASPAGKAAQPFERELNLHARAAAESRARRYAGGK